MTQNVHEIGKLPSCKCLLQILSQLIVFNFITHAKRGGWPQRATCANITYPSSPVSRENRTIRRKHKTIGRAFIHTPFAYLDRVNK